MIPDVTTPGSVASIGNIKRKEIIMRKMIRTLAPLALLLLIATAAFGTAQTESASADSQDDFVELEWLIFWAEDDDAQMVEDAVNEKLEELINAHLDINWIERGVYRERLRTMIAAGEEFDLLQTAPRFDYHSYASRGALMPLDDLLAEYGQYTLNMMPEEFWNATRVNGAIYGSPNYQIVARRYGFLAHTSLLEASGFDLESATTLEDIEPLLEYVKNNEPANDIPWHVRKNYPYDNDMQTYLGFDTIGGGTSPGVVAIGDASLTVFNQFASDSFRDYVDLMRSWYQKGYIKRDAATTVDDAGMVAEGLYPVEWAMVAPGFLQLMESGRGESLTYVNIVEPFVQTDSIIATMTGISRTSENPERAMMLIDLLNQDTEGLYNMLFYGIEGVHYELRDGFVHQFRAEDNSSPYDPNVFWQFGNTFNLLPREGADPDVPQQTLEMNENSVKSMLLGFNFNPEPVQTELAQAQSVVDEFMPALVAGSVDPDEYLPEFLEKLEAAGVERIIAEKQAQIRAWQETM
jgi:putative aldouronate transport system substrate-binding protein